MSAQIVCTIGVSLFASISAVRYLLMLKCPELALEHVVMLYVVILRLNAILIKNVMNNKQMLKTIQ